MPGWEELAFLKFVKNGYFVRISKNGQNFGVLFE